MWRPWSACARRCDGMTLKRRALLQQRRRCSRMCSATCSRRSTRRSGGTTSCCTPPRHAARQRLPGMVTHTQTHSCVSLHAYTHGCRCGHTHTTLSLTHTHTESFNHSGRNDVLCADSARQAAHSHPVSACVYEVAFPCVCARAGRRISEPICRSGASARTCCCPGCVCGWGTRAPCSGQSSWPAVQAPPSRRGLARCVCLYMCAHVCVVCVGLLVVNLAFGHLLHCVCVSMIDACGATSCVAVCECLCGRMCVCVAS